MSKHTTPAAQSATFTRETMRLSDFNRYLADVFGRDKVKGIVPAARYSRVEYLNAPAGLIVLAHHDSIDEQVDGIHPVALSKSIDNSRNIIEPLSSAYNIHYMTRRSTGSLVLEAFGYMIHPNDPDAHRLSAEDGHFRLEMFDAPIGPIVAIYEGRDTAHVIRPVSIDDADANALLEGGPA